MTQDAQRLTPEDEEGLDHARIVDGRLVNDFDEASGDDPDDGPGHEAGDPDVDAIWDEYEFAGSALPPETAAEAGVDDEEEAHLSPEERRRRRELIAQNLSDLRRREEEEREQERKREKEKSQSTSDDLAAAAIASGFLAAAADIGAASEWKVGFDMTGKAWFNRHWLKDEKTIAKNKSKIDRNLDKILSKALRNDWQYVCVTRMGKVNAMISSLLDNRRKDMVALYEHGDVKQKKRITTLLTGMGFVTETEQKRAIENLKSMTVLRERMDMRKLWDGAYSRRRNAAALENSRDITLARAPAGFRAPEPPASLPV